MATKWKKAIAEDTAKPPEGENELVYNYYIWGGGHNLVLEQAEKHDQIDVKCLVITHNNSLHLREIINMLCF